MVARALYGINVLCVDMFVGKQANQSMWCMRVKISTSIQSSD